jgi:N-acetylmuramate 1-kinase
MRPGLAQYDLASLLFDPYVRLHASERDEIRCYYLEQRGFTKKAASSFAETLRLCAMQRLMQALGAYGFLALAKGNRDFLAHVPAALASLQEIIEEMKELAPLGAALASLPGDVVTPG